MLSVCNDTARWARVGSFGEVEVVDMPESKGEQARLSALANKWARGVHASRLSLCEQARGAPKHAHSKHTTR